MTPSLLLLLSLVAQPPVFVVPGSNATHVELTNGRTRVVQTIDLEDGVVYWMDSTNNAGTVCLLPDDSEEGDSE